MAASTGTGIRSGTDTGGTEAGGARGVTAADVLDVAGRIVEAEGVEALTMRRLAEGLGSAVTSIYWHVGNRDAVLDGLVDRFLVEMAEVPDVPTAPPTERIALQARSLRAQLLTRPDMVGLVHARERTPEVFLPVLRAMAGELAELGVRGPDAALVLRSLEHHVIASVLLTRVASRSPTRDTTDARGWPDWADRELVDALAAPADHEAVFEHGLAAILAPWTGGGDGRGARASD